MALIRDPSTTTSEFCRTESLTASNTFTLRITVLGEDFWLGMGQRLASNL